MKKPKASCSRCGRIVWRSKTSRPEIVCHPCRRKRKGPYRPRRSKPEGGSEVHARGLSTPQSRQIPPRAVNAGVQETSQVSGPAFTEQAGEDA